MMWMNVYSVGILPFILLILCVSNKHSIRCFYLWQKKEEKNLVCQRFPRYKWSGIFLYTCLVFLLAGSYLSDTQLGLIDFLVDAVRLLSSSYNVIYRDVVDNLCPQQKQRTMRLYLFVSATDTKTDSHPVQNVQNDDAIQVILFLLAWSIRWFCLCLWIECRRVEQQICLQSSNHYASIFLCYLIHSHQIYSPGIDCGDGSLMLNRLKAIASFWKIDHLQSIWLKCCVIMVMGNKYHEWKAYESMRKNELRWAQNKQCR